MRGGAGRSEALEAERGRQQELGRARTGGEGGTKPQEGRGQALRSSGSPTRAQATAGKDRLGKGAGPGEPGKGRALWQSGAGASRGGAWQGGAGQRGWAERGCGRLFRAEAPPLLPSPPVLLQEGSRQRSEGRPSGSAGTLLSGTGRRGEGGPRFSLLRLLWPAVLSRHVPQQASCRGPAAAARGQRDLQVSAGPSRPQAQDGWAAGQGRGAGCPAAFWVKLSPAPGLALGPPSGPWGSAARPAPPVTVGYYPIGRN